MDTLDHVLSEDLELYVLGRLPPDRVDRLEDHLLVCEPCRFALDEDAANCAVLRRELAIEEKPQPRAWFSFLKTPSWALAAAALFMAAGTGWFISRPAAPRVPLAAIQLLAMRGEMAVTPRARQTELQLMDANDFSGNAEVVDADGAAVWKGVIAGGHALRIAKPLDAGVYFVRLYDGSRLMHEYGFRVH